MTVLASLACVVSPTGISRPAFSDILETLQAKFQGIYGTDAYIDPDSQDGQLLAFLAKGYDDCNAAAVAAYNSYSPATAQGVALSNAVKINGLRRAIATNSTVDLTITGTVGVVLTGAVAKDSLGNRWLIPDGTTIGVSGTVVTTATAEVAGAVGAQAGTVTIIDTPILGWVSVTNAAASVSGAPVEIDAQLRKRQAVSTALPSRTVLDGVKGAILALTGVTAAEVYENDTNVTDANGLTAHSIAAVVIGGTSADIGNAIMRKKTPGCSTLGTTAVATVDPGGIAGTMHYYPATLKRVLMTVTIKALAGYTTTNGDSIKAAVAAYVNALGIGKKVDLGRLYVPTQLWFGNPPPAFQNLGLVLTGSETFEVNAITQSFSPAAQSAADLQPAFNEYANLVVADITLTVT